MSSENNDLAFGIFKPLGLLSENSILAFDTLTDFLFFISIIYLSFDNIKIMVIMMVMMVMMIIVMDGDGQRTHFLPEIQEQES